MITPGTVQQGQTKARVFSEGDLVVDAVAPLLSADLEIYVDGERIEQP